MALRNRYLNDSTEEFFESNRLILRKLTSVKSGLQSYRKKDSKSSQLKQILLNSKFYLRKKRLVDISTENQRIFQKIHYHRHHKPKPLEWTHLQERSMAVHPITEITCRKKSKRLQIDCENKENRSRMSMHSPLKEIISSYKMTDRRRTQT